MYCSEAESILSQRCPNFYRKFKKQHENDDTVVFPISDDKFDCSEAVTPERLYWETRIREEYRESYELYRLCSELNAFVFYVGCRLYAKNPEIAAELGNYKALREQYQANPSDKLMWRIRDFYPQPGRILSAQSLCDSLRRSTPKSKGHAELIDETMGALDSATAYEPDSCECCIKYDPRLALPVGDILEEFLRKKLITPQDLERRDCARFLKQGNVGKENAEVKKVTLAY